MALDSHTEPGQVAWATKLATLQLPHRRAGRPESDTPTPTQSPNYTTHYEATVFDYHPITIRYLVMSALVALSGSATAERVWLQYPGKLGYQYTARLQ